MKTETEPALTARDIDPREWGKVILEEILFRAARDISAKGGAHGGTSVALEFRVAPDPDTRTITITTPGAVEPLITVRLPLEG